MWSQHATLCLAHTRSAQNQLVCFAYYARKLNEPVSLRNRRLKIVVIRVTFVGHRSNALALPEQSSREQLAIAEYARSLLVIPKTLAVNAAKDATDLVAKLRAYHNSSQTKQEHAQLKW